MKLVPVTTCQYLDQPYRSSVGSDLAGAGAFSELEFLSRDMQEEKMPNLMHQYKKPSFPRKPAVYAD
jgi:hypothetical protein